MKRSKIYTLLTLFFVILFAACQKPSPGPDGGTVVPPKDQVIEIFSKQARVNIKNENISSYDFKSLFTITVDGEEIEVLDKY